MSIASQPEAAVAVMNASSMPAMDTRPLVGREVTIRIGVTPGVVTLFAAPVTVAMTCLVGWFLLQTFGLPIYAHEMLAGGLTNTFGGMLAAIPLMFLMKHGTAAIAQAGLVSMAIRCAVILMGLLLAMAPAWNLKIMPLVYWTLGNYFPLLMVETAIVAWLCQKSRL